MTTAAGHAASRSSTGAPAPPPGPLTTAELDTLVGTGSARSRYRSVWHGVYRRDDQVDDLSLRSIALARQWPGGVLCGRSAALVWGDDSAPGDAVPEIRLPATRKQATGRRYRFGRLAESEIALTQTSCGRTVRLTSPERTARDLVAHLAVDEAIVALDRLCARREGLLDRLWAEAAVVPDPARWVGILGEVRPASACPAESRARRVLRATGLQGVEAGHRVATNGGRVRVGLAVPARRVVVEVRAARRPGEHRVGDTRHWTEIRRAGWTVVVVTGGPERVPGPWVRHARTTDPADVLATAGWEVEVLAPSPPARGAPPSDPAGLFGP